MTPLDRDCPVAITEPAAIFWQLIKRPPVQEARYPACHARWAAHLGFTMAEAVRAAEALPVPELLTPLPAHDR